MEDLTGEKRRPTPFTRTTLEPIEKVRVGVLAVAAGLWLVAQALLFVLPLVLSSADWQQIDTSVSLASAFLANGIALGVGYYFGRK